MRQAYGGTWLIQFVLVFIILFAVYIVLTLDYSKTIKVKNEAISIIEKYDGLNEKSISTLNNYLASSGYRTMGGCGERDDFYGATDLSASELEIAENGKKYYYCIKKYKGNKNTYYYQISLFYNFNINFLGVSTYYTVKGTTSSFEPHDDAAYGGSPNYIPANPTPTPPSDTNNPTNPTDSTYCIIKNMNPEIFIVRKSDLVGSNSGVFNNVNIEEAPKANPNNLQIGTEYFFALKVELERADSNFYDYDSGANAYSCKLKNEYIKVDNSAFKNQNDQTLYFKEGNSVLYTIHNLVYTGGVHTIEIMDEDVYGNKSTYTLTYGNSPTTPNNPSTLKYTVRFDTEGLKNIPTKEVENGNTVGNPGIVEKPYWNFDGWYLGNTKYRFETPVTSNITLKAKWYAPSSVTEMALEFITRWQNGEDIVEQHRHDFYAYNMEIFEYSKVTAEENQNRVDEVLTLGRDSDGLCKTYKTLYPDKYREIYGTNDHKCVQEAFQWWGINLNTRWYRYRRNYPR